MGLRVERAHCHGISGLSDYHQERTSPTYSQRKNNPTVTLWHPKAAVPKMWLSWNEVFRWRQTLARPSVVRSNKRLSSDQWTRHHVRMVHPKWSCDQSNRAWRWCNVNCERFMGRRTRIPWWRRLLITVRVLSYHEVHQLYCTAVVAPVWIWAGPLSASFCDVYLHVDGQ
jgi:hypothetical protein